MGTLSSRSRLRFAVLCDGETVEKWQLRSIDRLERSGAAECVAIVVPGQSPAGPPRKSKLNRNSLYNLYFRLVSRKCGAKAPASIAEGRPNVPVIRVKTERRPRGRTAVDAAGLALLADLDLDFAVRFGFGILSGDILRLPRHGVWSYHHGDPSRFRGQPPGVWEIYRGSPVTGAIVQRLDETLDDGEILARATFPTFGGSYARQLDALLDGSTSLLANVARHCAVHGETPKVAAGKPGPIYRKPTNGEMLRLALVMAVNRLGSVLGSLFRHQQWALVVADARLETILEKGMGVPLDRYLDSAAAVPEEKGMFAADPFLVARPASRDSGPEIVFERFDWRTGKGHIASVRAEGGGRFSHPVPVLELETHLSYPFVSSRDGKASIVPESCDGGRLVEYALGLPGAQARPVHDHGVAVLDPTILFHNGRYWMFYCGDAHNSHLCVRHAASADGPWTEHALNPVKIDVGNARPAGPILASGGELYRPAQICVPIYGQGIVFNKIVRLDEDFYLEEPVASIVPARSGRYRHGVHTVAQGDGILVFDRARMMFSPYEALRQVSAKLGKLLGTNRP